MKSKLLRIAWTLALAALLLAYFGCEDKGPANLRAGTGGIFVWGDIDQAKWDKIKDVLRKTSAPGASKRSELYRLRKYDPPHDPVDVGGELCDAMLIRTIKDVDEHAAAVTFKGYAVQIGLGALADFESQMPDEEKKEERGGDKETPRPKTLKLMPHAHFQENITESQKMVDEVNAILDGTADESSH